MSEASSSISSINEQEIEQENEENQAIYLVDALKHFESTQLTSLDQLCRLPSSNTASTTSTMPPSLAVQCLVTLINSDVADDPATREPETILVDTCRYLIATLQKLYQQAVDPTATAGVQKALSVRIPALPADQRLKLDGCATILAPPDTLNQVHPSAMKEKVRQYLAKLQSMGLGFGRQVSGVKKDDGTLMSLDELCERNVDFDFFLFNMFNDYDVNDCIAAFLPSDVDIDEHIENYANQMAGDDDDGQSEKKHSLVHVCAFAGIVKSLADYDEYRRNKNSKKKAKEANENTSAADDKEEDKLDESGHIQYEEEEPEMYYGWTGSWPVNEDEPKNNNFLYGVKLGTILHHAEEYAKVVLSKPTIGPKYSSPYARFHVDMSKEDSEPKENDKPTTPHDIEICRARHCHLDSDAFGGDGSVYSANGWSHDGRIGFAHTGSGWKNREFNGVLYSFDVTTQPGNDRGFAKMEFRHEFWETPDEILADNVNDTAWICADRRIKGFSISRGDDPEQVPRFYTSYIFNMVDNPRSSCSITAGDTKRRKVLESNKAEHGRANLMVFGSCRVGFLNRGYLQEWNLDDSNRHDGVSRMVDMSSVSEDIAEWNEEDVLDWSDCTWMDESGAAEVSRGVKPDSIRPVDIVTPTSIGYLPNDRLAFANARFEGAHFSNGQIPIYNHELREVARIAGLCDDGINIVQRPVFPGDESTFVANDSSCVKVFDLRSGKAEITIDQRCSTATPVFIGDAKYVCNKLYDGKGAMMWDLRTRSPIYSLPVPSNSDIAWVPTIEGTSKPPILMSGNGEMYVFDCSNDGITDQERGWDEEEAIASWMKLDKSKSGGCSIM